MPADDAQPRPDPLTENESRTGDNQPRGRHENVASFRADRPVHQRGRHEKHVWDEVVPIDGPEPEQAPTSGEGWVSEEKHQKSPAGTTAETGDPEVDRPEGGWEESWVEEDPDSQTAEKSEEGAGEVLGVQDPESLGITELLELGGGPADIELVGVEVGWEDAWEDPEQTGKAGTSENSPEEVAGVEAYPAGGQQEDPEVDEEGDPEEGDPEEKSWWRRAVRRGMWSAVVLAAVWMVSAWFGVVLNTNIPYYLMTPGPVEPAGLHLSVTDGDPSQFELNYLSVAVSRAKVSDAIDAWLDPAATLEPVEKVSGALTPEEAEQYAKTLMAESQAVAQVVAFEWLGYDVGLQGEGAKVLTVVPDSPAGAAGLKPGDVLVGVGRAPVNIAEDLVALLGEKQPGEVVTLQVKTGEQRKSVAVRLASMDITGPQGNQIVDKDHPMLGVIVETLNPHASMPQEVTYNIQGVGGPSAGLAWALEIVDQMTPGSLTNDRKVAVTGALTPTGKVAEIGGVWQKTHGAIAAGAELILVPEKNYAEAAAAAGGSIQVVGVATFEDAIKALGG